MAQNDVKTYLTYQTEKLNGLTAVVMKSFNDSDKSNIPAEWLKITIDKFNFPEKYISKQNAYVISTLFQFVETFIRDAPKRKDKNTGRPLTTNNIQQYRNTEKHLRDFARSIHKKDFDFSDIDQLHNSNFYITFAP